MKILLNKAEVAQVIKDYYRDCVVGSGGMGMMEVTDVRITPYGEYVADITLAEYTKEVAPQEDPMLDENANPTATGEDS